HTGPGHPQGFRHRGPPRAGQMELAGLQPLPTRVRIGALVTHGRPRPEESPTEAVPRGLPRLPPALDTIQSRAPVPLHRRRTSRPRGVAPTEAHAAALPAHLWSD